MSSHAVAIALSGSMIALMLGLLWRFHVRSRKKEDRLSALVESLGKEPQRITQVKRKIKASESGPRPTIEIALSDTAQNASRP